MGGAMASSSKAAKFHFLQLRSVIDDPAMGDGAGADETWARLLASGRVRRHAEPCVNMALPSSEDAEQALLEAVEHLADALSSVQALRGLYRRLGWGSSEQYFEAMGPMQVMFVDTDYNDLDDRLAIMLLAYQMASANLDRRSKSAGARCCLYLDCRTYETTSGLTIWRTLRLAERLQRDLESAGLELVLVLSDRVAALGLIAGYLGCQAAYEALDQRAPGTGALLSGAASGGRVVPGLKDSWPTRSKVALWILSGLCASQVDDITDGCEHKDGPRFVVFEQAQPAWQSMEVPEDAETQPAWDLKELTSIDGVDPVRADDVEAAARVADVAAMLDRGFGAEPSNIRSGEAPYPVILDTYMQLQEAVAICPERFEYTCPALNRVPGPLPAPVGQPMHRIAARPLTVVPGEIFEVRKAVDMPRAEAAFAKLLSAARASAAETAYPELSQDALDDHRRDRGGVIDYNGSPLADALLVALVARPPAALGAVAVVRRLAVVDLAPEGAGRCRRIDGVEEVPSAVHLSCWPGICCVTHDR
mmetsp:Transcript_122013/g.352528  ORF Transcript_122013/g.352528 Transcript_122013/m.352528 type:complete len:534 (-) Transcript_122013:101-1702(-)